MVDSARLAKTVKGEDTTSTPPLALRQAEVVSIQTGPPASSTVRIGGSVVDVAGVRSLDSASPGAGDKAWVLMSGEAPLLIGTQAGKTPLPPGVILAYGGTTAPTGFLLRNGQNVSRTVYAGLFAVFGSAYGAGDGSTTFGVGNGAGRATIGAGTLGSDTYSRGQTGGEARHALTTGELAAHTHSIDLIQHNTTSHVHNSVSGVSAAANQTGTSSGATNSTGSGTAHENRMPFLVDTFIVST